MTEEVYIMLKIAELGFSSVMELVLDSMINQFEDWVKKAKWSKLFREANKKIVDEDGIVSDIAKVLNGEEIKNIAKNSRGGSYYELKEAIHNELKEIMVIKYDISEENSERYISSFIKEVIERIEKEYPEIYEKLFLGEWRKQENDKLSDIEKELNSINLKLESALDNTIKLYSIEMIDEELKNNTSNPSLSLDFFEIDDEVFKDDFEDCLSNENIYVCGQCKEETILCVLNELKNVYRKDNVYVVKSEKDWNELRAGEPKIEGKILIPWFHAGEIYSIKNNTNIFVLGEDDINAGKKCLNLRKRKKSTVRKKLEDAGANYEVAFQLVEDTHGLYLPLKNKLINGVNNAKPEWAKKDAILISLLLCGKWTENEGDIMVIEELCGKPYTQILDIINPYMRGENPLFVRFKMYGTVIIHLASVDNAWDYLAECVKAESEAWNKYVELVKLTVLEENPEYNYSAEKRLFASSFAGGKPIWSMTLKEGLLRSLILKAYYKNDDDSQAIVDKVVKDILDNLQNKRQWLSISRYFSLLCEASPMAIMKRLDDEWDNNTGLTEIFSEVGNNGMLSTNDYTYFIWGIEQLLYQKKYAIWATEWLLKMNNLREKYQLTNSPYATLQMVFCPWYNATALEQNEKVEIVKDAFNKGHNIWNLIFDSLPINNKSILKTSSKPKYREIDEASVLTNGDVIFASEEYYKLCLKFTNYSVDRWKKIINGVKYYVKSSLFLNTTEQLLLETNTMTDQDKVEIKESVRKEIFINRFFNDSEWAMPEDAIKELENLIDQIHMKDDVYEFRYLFIPIHDFPLLNPCVYSDERHMKKNESMIFKEIEKGLEEYRNRNFDVISLVRVCSKMNQTTLGKYLFIVYSDGVFDEEMYSAIIRENSGIALDYAREAANKNDIIVEKAVTIAKKMNISEEIIVELLGLELLDATKPMLIDKEKDNIKKIYWQHNALRYYADNLETFNYIICEALEYSNVEKALETLDLNKDIFELDEVLKYLEIASYKKDAEWNDSAIYHLGHLVSRLQDEFINSDKCERIALLELSFRGLIRESEMVCFKKCLQDSPKSLLAILSIIYKTDDGGKTNDYVFNGEQIGSLYVFYHNLSFCPACEGNTVNRDKLFHWIEELEEGLKMNNQNRLLGSVLGKVFSSSPIGDDGYYPAEAVRDAIEKYCNQDLEESFIIATYNKRGVYSPSGGKEERKMANSFKENADSIRKWSKTARIYDHLSERYLREADAEREIDEYAGV
ncbi:MAG: hypothetical protein E7189_02070 [Erysipelotrichaceae bacterium]|nr:hypothetical protein [Erysipelotrichaceae bacterium]